MSCSSIFGQEKLQIGSETTLSCSSIFGQEKLQIGSETTWELFKYDTARIFGGMGYVYGRPLYWEKEDWFALGGVTLATGLSYLLDDASSELFVNQGKYVPTAIMDYGFNVGSPQNNYMITGGVYLTGLFIKSEKLRRTGVLLVSSASAVGLLQQLLKSAVGRARPISGMSKDTFRPFNSNREFHSFPSGHTMLAFTNAYAIAKQFKNKWIKTGLYGVGLVPGLSRLWDGEHWLSDVVMGIAVSIFTVEAIDKYLDNEYDKKYNMEDKKIDWRLNLTPSQVGLVIDF
ncbi:phosphatase PAP2 family protein [Flagellimonas lutimaris]|uniref:phosphatase PAP2 family protein n=1 Tax=Flagellimonas lutimaris TaxID=475082 RepID=UPI001FE2933C|nr:phosphatase PAP2 family protein [Allomuricauda lutimaris]